jgi:hypothetical protein
MPFVDWTSHREGRVAYNYGSFAAAKSWMFDQWTDFAAERGLARPVDLSGSCKYGSIFVQSVFGGSIRGHFEHQYNFLGGRLVDMSHDALDVGRMRNPYLHEPEYFNIPELQTSLATCVARAERWADEFVEARARFEAEPEQSERAHIKK